MLDLMLEKMLRGQEDGGDGFSKVMRCRLFTVTGGGYASRICNIVAEEEEKTRHVMMSYDKSRDLLVFAEGGIPDHMWSLLGVLSSRLMSVYRRVVNPEAKLEITALPGAKDRRNLDFSMTENGHTWSTIRGPLIRPITKGDVTIGAPVVRPGATTGKAERVSEYVNRFTLKKLGKTDRWDSLMDLMNMADEALAPSTHVDGGPKPSRPASPWDVLSE